MSFVVLWKFIHNPHMCSFAVGHCISWEQVLNLEFRTAVMSPQNLIIGLDRCALKLMNLNVQNIKQSAL